MTAWMLGLVVKSTLLLASVGLLAAATRRSSAATRHFVWLCGLTVLLLMPALGLLAPSWSPAWVGGWVPEYLVEDSTAVAQPAGELRVVLDSAALLEATVAESLPIGSSVIASPQLLAETIDAPTTISTTAPIRRDLATALPQLIAAVWALGMAAMGLRLAAGFVQRFRLSRRARRVDGGELRRATIVAAQDLGVRRPIQILLGDSKTVPMTWGILRPVLFLPLAAEGWAPERLRDVVLHELAHIKRHDSLCRTLAQLACATFWFHPLAWYAAGRMHREQERACDDVVILAGANPHQYAETLVAIAREFRSPVPGVAGALAFSRRSNLEHRLLSILDPLKRRQKMTLLRRLAMFAAFVALVLPLAALQPAANAQQADAVEPQQGTSAKQRETIVPRARQNARVDVAANVAVAPRADVSVAQNVVAAPQPDASVAQNVVAAPQPDASISQNLVAAPRPDASVSQNVVAAPRPDASVSQNVVAAPQPDAGPAPNVVVAPQADASQTRHAQARAEARQETRAEQRDQRQRVRVATRIRESVRIRIEVRGVSRLGERIGDVELEEGGRLRISEDDREVEVVPAEGGGTAINYRFAGEEAEFDDEAREWANGILERIAGLTDLGKDMVLRISRRNLQSDEVGPIVLSITTAREPHKVTIVRPVEISTTVDGVTISSLEEALVETDILVGELATAIDIDIDEAAIIELSDALQEVDIEVGELTTSLEHLSLAESIAVDVATDIEGRTILELKSLDLEEAVQVAVFDVADDIVESLFIEIVDPELDVPTELGVAPDVAGTWSIDLATRRWDRLVTWRHEGSRVVAMWRGSVAIGAGVDSLELGPDADFVVDERSDDGTHRRLHVTADNEGTVLFEWFVDGEETPFDEAGRAWLETILERIEDRGDR